MVVVVEGLFAASALVILLQAALGYGVFKM